jgi:class 3 adenylate cyclase/predicted ATPase
MEPDRRAVTVMFCDLVGSTEMSDLLDPEELLEVVTAYQLTCRDIVQKHEGHVAKYLGDGVLVFFGYPMAHDDDVQRSVRAGLEIVQSMEELNARVGIDAAVLKTRIGIHVGDVVAGMLEPGSGELVVVGSTPNIASRLQDLAEPDSVVVSADVQRLVEGYFHWHELGEFRLRGIGAPMRAYRPLEPSAIRTPFELAIRQGLRPLVGREVELAALGDLWRQTQEGHGHVVRMSGEGGIGKSRLLHALHERGEPPEATWLTGRCTPHTRNTSFYPVLEVVRNLLGISGRDIPDDRLREIQATLDGFEDPDAFRLLRAFLSLESEDAEPLQLSPELQRRRTMETIVALVGHHSRLSPVAITIEDLHWVDPSSLELLDLLTAAIEHERVLLLLSYRPTFRPAPSPPEHIVELLLAPLDAADVRDLVTSVAGDRVLRPDVVDQIVERADGVPLFVEELTKMVLESTEVAVNSGRNGTGTDPITIPITLDSSLRTRLDRLGDAKTVVQLAAVLGRDFDWRMLRSCEVVDEEQLGHSLDTLVGAELVGQVGSPPDAHYTFHHALIQDAAYKSLMKGVRREYHGRIAELALAEQWDVLVDQPEFVAHHFTEAAMHGPAADQWLLAGQRAVDRSAYVEAIADFERGLAEAEALPDERPRWKVELALVMGLGPAFNSSRGYGSSEAEQAYTRAMELCERIGDAPELFWVLWGLGAFRQARGQYVEALEKGRQIESLAESRPELLAEAMFGVGTSLFYLGDLVGGKEALEKGADYFIEQAEEHNVSPSGHHAGVMSLGYLGIALWHLGYPEQAQVRMQQGIDLADAMGQPFARVQSFHWASFVAYLERDRTKLRELGEAEGAIATEFGLPFGELGSMMALSWLAATDGDAGAVEMLRFGVDAYRGIGARVCLTYFLAMLADAYSAVGRTDDALGAIDEAMRELADTGERAWESELHRIRGELLAPSDPAEAERCIHAALTIADAQGARSLALRAAMSLADLLDGAERRAGALARVATIFDGFSEGHSTADLVRARRMLDGAPVVEPA